uniref:Conotoxin Pu6.1 n=1 Tax=Conus pulicarius TaxID=93154 RepID=I361_CONPL|nr:RecName: Full=Conotoxin Pu6.1; Flags: Precursor [Conus pulicarius]ACU30045.1 conotoxin 6.1 [Conus pulicarius]
MKLVLAIVLILMLVSLSTGAEESGQEISMVGPPLYIWDPIPPCKQLDEDCGYGYSCCEDLSCQPLIEPDTMEITALVCQIESA